MTAGQGETGDTGARRALKRGLIALIAENLWAILSAVGAGITGAVLGYTSVAIQIADLRHTAADLKETVATLATRDQVAAVNQRINDWEVIWRREADKDPQPRRRR